MVKREMEAGDKKIKMRGAACLNYLDCSYQLGHLDP